MTHRVVYLDDDETRCRPFAKPCPMKDHCARFQAPIQAKKAKVSDYSNAIVQATDGPACGYYFALSKAVAPVAGKPPAKKPIGSAP